jgi:hypothetical protein
VAHVTFIKGIGNNPESQVLLAQMRTALVDDDVDLDGQGVTSSVPYPADFLQDKLAPPSAAQESTELGSASSTDAGSADLSWPADVPPGERTPVQPTAQSAALQEQFE